MISDINVISLAVSVRRWPVLSQLCLLALWQIPETIFLPIRILITFNAESSKAKRWSARPPTKTKVVVQIWWLLPWWMRYQKLPSQTLLSHFTGAAGAAFIE